VTCFLIKYCEGCCEQCAVTSALQITGFQVAKFERTKASKNKACAGLHLYHLCMRVYMYIIYIYTHHICICIYIIWLGGWPKKRTYNRTPETIPAVWGRGGRWADRALISEGMDQLCYVRCYPWYMDRWFRNRSNWIVYIYDNILNYIIHNMI